MSQAMLLSDIGPDAVSIWLSAIPACSAWAAGVAGAALLWLASPHMADAPKPVLNSIASTVRAVSASRNDRV